MKYVIEHLEPELSEWLKIEYSEASKIVGKESLIFSNVGNSADAGWLGQHGTVKKESCTQFLKNAIVLEPKAGKLLEPEDTKKAEAIVIGGILGDAVPSGRTYERITKKMEAIPRSLGRHQLSIEGAVFMARKVEEGRQMGELLVANRPEIELGPGCTITLEYAVPVWEGRPVIPEKLIEYFKKDGNCQ